MLSKPYHRYYGKVESGTSVWPIVGRNSKHFLDILERGRSLSNRGRYDRFNGICRWLRGSRVCESMREAKIFALVRRSQLRVESERESQLLVYRSL